jgi:adenylate kinase family enzyme
MSDFNTKVQIIVQLQIAALHCWPQAAEIEPSVSYLAEVHRHVFYIKAKRKVSHDDRDIEIILFKQSIEQYLKGRYFNQDLGICIFGSKSCEMLAQELSLMFHLDYCEITEDNENGACVEKIPNVENLRGKIIDFIYGLPCSGKTTYCDQITKDGIFRPSRINVSESVRKLTNFNSTKDLITTVDLNPYDLAFELITQISQAHKERSMQIIVDGLRQFSAFKIIYAWLKATDLISYHYFLEVPIEELRNRFEKRNRDTDKSVDFDQIVKSAIEMGLNDIKTFIQQNSSVAFNLVTQ